MITPGLRAVMRIPTLALVLGLVAAFGLCACVPDVVSIEPIPTPKFARDLKACETAAKDAFWPDDPVKRCMKEKGYRFLRQY
jgi:hypothetical protein